MFATIFSKFVLSLKSFVAKLFQASCPYVYVYLLIIYIYIHMYYLNGFDMFHINTCRCPSRQPIGTEAVAAA